jgi:hypothetical protein
MSRLRDAGGYVCDPVEDPAGPVLAPDPLGSFEEARPLWTGSGRMLRKQRLPAQHDRGGRRRRVDVVACDERSPLVIEVDDPIHAD